MALERSCELEFYREKEGHFSQRKPDIPRNLIRTVSSSSESGWHTGNNCPSQEHLAGRRMLGHPVQYPDAKWKSWPFFRMQSRGLLSKGRQSKLCWACVCAGETQESYTTGDGGHGQSPRLSLQAGLSHKCCCFAQSNLSLESCNYPSCFSHLCKSSESHVRDDLFVIVIKHR